MDSKTGEAYNISKPIPLPALNAMVSHGRVELLAHPLSTKYLQMKWNSYGKYFHVANVLFYSIFLAFVTCFCAQLMKHYELRPYLHLSEMRNKTNFTQMDLSSVPMMGVSSLAIIVYIALSSVREFIQMYQQKCLYLLDPLNLVSWLLYSSSLVTVLHIYGEENDELQFTCASLTVFLSWLNLLLLLQRFDQVGIYVVMFLEILQTLVKVLMVFSILIVAFGLAFYILLYRGNHHAFHSIPISLIRTFSMMLGEIDFLGTYVKLTDGELPYPMPTFFILIIFMVLMPILLMNLLIGLAVGDIESVRRNAQLKRLAMQVVLHTELERKLPNKLLEKIDRTEIIEYPNDTKSVGFFDTILRKWFGNPFSDNGVDMIMDSGEDYLVQELDKTKRKLREISSALETQQQFLRLIVQKMEIKSEAEELDEGVSPNELNPLLSHSSKWTSPKIRKRLRSMMSFNKGP